MNQSSANPSQKFIRIESFGGILLLAATVIALVWANSPLKESYQAIWDYQLGFKSQDIDLVKPLRLWVNDGLMAVFFFLIGLEIKREMLIGELNSLRKASLPLLAAVGGMVIPASLFLLLNGNPETARGWGIPIATDIAFSLAILQMLGKRVPLGLKVFLTAFAIVDDLGAVLVIAFFYSSGIKLLLITAGLLLILGLGLVSRYLAYSKYLVLAVGIAAWILFLKSGVHPTIAGVLLALTIPLRQRTSLKNYAGNLEEIARTLQTCPESTKPILSKRQIAIIDDLEDWTDKVQSPLQHLEHSLHNWVAWVVMPLFALANAGIAFSSGVPPDYSLVVNLSVSLIIGKSLGISLFSWIGLKTKLIELPTGTGFRHIIGVSFLAGVGFTMSIFIATLAFSGNPAFIDSAKGGILAGSALSGIIGYLFIRFNGKPKGN